MTQKFANNAMSILAAGIAADAVALSVKAGDGAKFPTLAADDYFLATLYQLSGSVEVNIEVVKVTAVSGDTFTIVRAQEGTIARPYNANDPIQLRFTAGTADRAIQGATGGPGNYAFFLADNVIDADFTIPAGKNAITPTPFEIAAGVVIDVAPGSMWTWV